MNKIVKLILLLINISVIILSSIWACNTKYEPNPLIALLLSISSMIFLFYKSNGKTNDVKEIAKSKNTVKDSTFGNIGGDFQVGDSDTKSK